MSCFCFGVWSFGRLFGLVGSWGFFVNFVLCFVFALSENETYHFERKTGTLDILFQSQGS